MMQADTATIADAAEVWMDLVGNEQLQDHAQAVRKRCDQALGPVHAAANMLDPRYRGRKLGIDLRHAAEEWVGEELLADLVLLQTEQPPYPDTFFKPEFIKKLTPVMVAGSQAAAWCEHNALRQGIDDHGHATLVGKCRAHILELRASSNEAAEPTGHGYCRKARLLPPLPERKQGDRLVTDTQVTPKKSCDAQPVAVDRLGCG